MTPEAGNSPLAACSPVSGASSLDSRTPGCASSGTPNATSSANEFSNVTGLESLATETSAKSQARSLRRPISYAAGFRARTSVSLDVVPALTARRADFGRSSIERLASFDPDTSLWRTSQMSLFSEQAEYSETWPAAGMTRNGTAYRLPPSAPFIYELASG